MQLKKCVESVKNEIFSPNYPNVRLFPRKICPYRKCTQQKFYEIVILFYIDTYMHKSYVLPHTSLMLGG